MLNPVPEVPEDPLVPEDPEVPEVPDFPTVYTQVKYSDGNNGAPEPPEIYVTLIVKIEPFQDGKVLILY